MFLSGLAFENQEMKKIYGLSAPLQPPGLQPTTTKAEISITGLLLIAP